MSQQDVETARRGYAAINDAYRSGDVDDFRPFLEEIWEQDAVITPAGVLPESRPARGWDAILRYMAEQMNAFETGSMWMKPAEYIDGGGRVVVPYTMGGRARHTGIDVEFSFVHVFTMRDGKVMRLDVYEGKAAALEAAGLSE
jgi:ketosteroid isomerase-like protein